jgi:hypothetical protein
VRRKAARPSNTSSEQESVALFAKTDGKNEATKESQEKSQEKSKEAERRETRSPTVRTLRCGSAQIAARSPFGVPPRRLLQRTNATAQPKLRASWDGTGEERVLAAPGRPPVQRSLDRRPVIVPAGRNRLGRPGT